MNLTNLFKIAFKALSNNKLRGFLTMLGIIIGVGSVITMLAIGQGSKRSIQAQISEMGSNMIMIHPGGDRRGGVRLDAADMESLKLKDLEDIQAQARYISYISPSVNSSGQAIFGANNTPTTVYGISPEYLDIRRYKVEDGDIFSEQDVKTAAKVCLVGKSVVDELFPDGESPVGKVIRFGKIPLRIVGVLESKGYNSMGMDQDDLILAPYTTVQKRILAITHLQSITCSALSEEYTDQAIEEITQILRTNHKLKATDEDDFTIRSQQELSSMLTSTTDMMTLLLAAVALTALVPVLPARAEGNAPVAQNLELTTYRNVSVGGRLTAVDPDGDTLTFQITTEPTKGEIELTDDGRFVYTPDTNRRGRDYFGFKAVDAEGNSSQEATVIIRIEKQKTRTTYSDLDGNACAYAATMLAEEGIFVGQQLGGSYVFEPDREVTRGEFLAMCMELGGDELLSAVAATGFADDDAIPVWQKPYVATALMDGVINGTESEGSAVFSAGDAVTVQEAAVMLNNVLGATDVPTAAFDSAVPAWASQATANLTACGVLAVSGRYTDSLTRADAAEMLSAAIAVRDSRE